MTYLDIKGNVTAEFIPENPGTELSAGRLIFRSLSSEDNTFAHFDLFFKVMARYALNCEPPIRLDRGDTRLVYYDADQSEMHPNTFGIEATIPEGHLVSADFYRRQPEPSLR